MKKTKEKPFYAKPGPILAIIVLGGLGYSLTAPTGSSASTTKATTKKKSSSQAKTAIVFTKQDEQASFGRVETPKIAQSAFMPVVMKGGLGGGTAMNAIPADFTGGEGNWVYTGSATVDGHTQVLLENRKTGEGVFLSVGQKWKSAIVKKIGLDSVVMEGPSGVRTFGLLHEESVSGMAGRVARREINTSGNFSPMQVNIPGGPRGQTGQLPSVSPRDDSFSSAQSLPVPPDGVFFDGN